MTQKNRVCKRCHALAGAFVAYEDGLEHHWHTTLRSLEHLRFNTRGRNDEGEEGDLEAKMCFDCVNTQTHTHTHTRTIW